MSTPYPVTYNIEGLIEEVTESKGFVEYMHAYYVGRAEYYKNKMEATDDPARKEIYRIISERYQGWADSIASIPAALATMITTLQGLIA